MRPRLSQILAFAAIALLALNLRIAVSSLSPLVTLISAEIPLPLVGIGIIGLIAPITFALSGSVTPLGTKKFGLEKTLAIAIAMMITGHLLRGLAWDFSSLVLGSVLALLAMGIGNVLLPVMVRKYFHHRVGLVSSVYLTLTAVSATTAPLIGVPIAEATSWRFSLGQWALLACLAAVPMIALIPKRTAPVEIEQASNHTVKIWKSPTALAIAVTLAMTSTYGYTSFAWLPLLVQEHAGVTILESGVLLALFAAMGLPPSLAVPFIAAKFPRWQARLVFISIACGATGAIGLALAPQWGLAFWVALLGLGPIAFPLTLTLFNLRARNRATVLALSSFAQTFAYTVAAAAVLLTGVLRDLTGGWVWFLAALAGLTLLVSLAGWQLTKGKFVDDELAEAGLGKP